MNRPTAVNDKIRAHTVAVIDQNGGSLGVMPLRDALAAASARALDLVEVNPTANPPVCKLMDFGRFQFEQSKRQRESTKGSKGPTLKEIRFRPNVGEHDVATKIKTIREFLDEGHKVKITVRMRGRELAHPERADVLLTGLADQLKPHTVERTAPSDARARTMIITPAKTPKPV